MGNFCAEAIGAVKDFWRNFFHSEDESRTEALLGAVCESFYFVGIARDDLCRSKQEFAGFLNRSEQLLANMSIDLDGNDYTARLLAENVCLVSGTATLRENVSVKARFALELTLRFTAALLLEDGRPVLSGIHCSLPSTTQTDAFIQSQAKANIVLQNRIKEINETLERKSRELSEQQKAYKLALDATDDIIIFMDLTDSSVSYDAEKLRRLYGITLSARNKDDFIRLFSSLVHADDVERFNADTRMLVGDGSGIPDEIISGEYRLHIKDNYVWFQIFCIPVSDKDGKTARIIVHAKNVHSQKMREKQLKEKAEEDSLTGALNRRGVRERVDTYLIRENVGVLVEFDLDDFKLVNDSSGHPVGDKVLVAFCDILRAHVRERDFVARVGGDEFVVFITGAKPRAATEIAIKGVIESFDAYLESNSLAGMSSCSAGAAFVSPSARSYDVLFKMADDALYEVKARGKRGCAFKN